MKSEAPIGSQRWSTDARQSRGGSGLASFTRFVAKMAMAWAGQASHGGGELRILL